MKFLNQRKRNKFTISGWHRTECKRHLYDCPVSKFSGHFVMPFFFLSSWPFHLTSLRSICSFVKYLNLYSHKIERKLWIYTWFANVGEKTGIWVDKRYSGYSKEPKYTVHNLHSMLNIVFQFVAHSEYLHLNSVCTVLISNGWIQMEFHHVS